MDKKDENDQRSHWKKSGKYIFFLLSTFSGKKNWLSIYPRNFGRHVKCTSFTRPSTRPSAPLGNQPEISHFLASVGACNLILHIYVAVS